ncbi:MAG: hypothetical protein DRP45_07505 [Candidatus Zixiibacteriota bacterium]|nr:MAG: hypothetical protein DRP45_07505 [candidate division Zixibacteria bacterium]
MPVVARAYYHSTFQDFLTASDEEVLGHLSLRSELTLDQFQRNAWIDEFKVLRNALQGISGYILLEYSIPRMGRRVDAILLLPKVAAVVEFKVGETRYTSHAIDQVFDYALDLKNFHKQSHDKLVFPILVATEASGRPLSLTEHPDGLISPICANRHDFAEMLRVIMDRVSGPEINPAAWLDSIYCPTPTIVEAAQALYQGHNVKEISRSEAGAENLTKTTEAITKIITQSREKGTKSICFVTGVPGAGKTLAGLNIANSWHDPENGEHAVFLSGNGPLVNVLREALARDDVGRAKAAGEKLTKSTALSKVKAFVQNIHHFRDDLMASSAAPVERVAIFDEAQRAWDLKQTASFMKTRKGISNFGMSEPEFLISVMDRHNGWATLICLIGGGQEINTGEAGLTEWFKVLRLSYPEWSVFISDNLVDSEYTDVLTREVLSSMRCLEQRSDLHLATSIRSFRAEGVSSFVKALLDCEQDKAKDILGQVLPTFPIYVTRDIRFAKAWLRQKARGTERFGIIASSEAQRIKPFGFNVKAEIDPRHWFLNGKTDIRSSYYLEDVATEFQIQGLELDWTCVAWDGDLRFNEGGWEYHCFRGTRWQTIRSPENCKYLKNAYRVLLTRARQGMIIFVPNGNSDDHTRQQEFYDHTYEYLRGLGIPEITAQQEPKADVDKLHCSG